MKSIILKSFVILFLSIALLSCGSDNSDLETMIPADAVAMLSVRVPSIVEKSGMANGDEIQLPDTLKTVIQDNDDAFFCRLIKLMPRIGLKLKNNVYVFVPSEGFDVVAIASVYDSKKAMSIIKHVNGSDFEEVGDYSMLSADEGVFYATKGDIVLMAISQSGMTSEKAGKLLGEYFAKDKKDALQLDKIESLKTGADISGFADLTMLFNLATKSNTNSMLPAQLMKTFGTVENLGRLVFSVNFEKSKATMDVVVEGEQAVLPMIAKAITSAPSNSVLATIPVSMPTVISWSIDGSALCKLPMVQNLLSMAEQVPVVGDLNLTAMLSNISGPMTVGFAKDVFFDDDYNYAFAIQTNEPQAMLDFVKDFALKMGQDPDVVDGEQIYGWYNKQVRVGSLNNVTYAKLLNYEQMEGNSDGEQVLMDLLKSNPIALYHKTYLGWMSLSLDVSLAGTGVYQSNNELSSNAVIDILTLLCSIAPSKEESYTIESSMPEAIDEFVEF